MQAISIPTEFIALEQVPSPGDFYNLDEGIRVDAQRLDPLVLSVSGASGMSLSQTVQSNAVDALNQLGIDASIQISVMGGQFGLSAFAKLRKASSTTDDALSVVRRCRLPRERVSVDLESMLNHVQLPEDGNAATVPSAPFGWQSAKQCGATHVVMQVVRGHFAVLNVAFTDRGSSNLFSLAAGGSGTATYSGITGTLSASVQVEDDSANHTVSVDVRMCVSDNDTTKSISAGGLSGVQQYLDAVRAFNETAERLCINDQPTVTDFVLVPMGVLEGMQRSRRRAAANPSVSLAVRLNDGTTPSMSIQATSATHGVGLAAKFLSSVASASGDPLNLQGLMLRLVALSGQLSFLRQVLAEMKELCLSHRLRQWAMASEWYDDAAVRLAKAVEDGQRTLQLSDKDEPTISATTASLGTVVRWAVAHLMYQVLLDPVYALIHRIRAAMEWRQRLLLAHNLVVMDSLLDSRLQCSGAVPIAASGVAKIVAWTGTSDCTFYYRPAPTISATAGSVPDGEDTPQVAATTFRSVAQGRHCAVVAQVAAVANQRRDPPGGLGLCVVDMLSSFGISEQRIANGGAAVQPTPPPLAPTVEWSAWGRVVPSGDALLQPPRLRYLHGIVVVAPLNDNGPVQQPSRCWGMSRHIVPIVSGIPSAPSTRQHQQQLVLAAYWTYHPSNAATSVRVLNGKGECIADVLAQQLAAQGTTPSDEKGAALTPAAGGALPTTAVGNITVCALLNHSEAGDAVSDADAAVQLQQAMVKRYLSLDKHKVAPTATTANGHASVGTLREVITDIGLWLGPSPPSGRLWTSSHVGNNCWVCYRRTQTVVTTAPFVETGVYRIEPVGTDTPQAIGFNEHLATSEDRCADVREGVPVSAFAADVGDASQEWVVKRVGYDTYAVQAVCRIGVSWVWTTDGTADGSVALGRDAATTAQRFRIEWAGTDAAVGEDGSPPPDADVFTIKTLPSEKALAVLFDSASAPDARGSHVASFPTLKFRFHQVGLR